MTPALVISREGSARHLAVADHLRAAGIAHELSPAIFPEGAPPWSTHYDVASRLRNLGYPMDKGEVGCFLAHRAAWKTILARGWASALVMEDDARLSVGAAGIVEACTRVIDGTGCYVRLYPGKAGSGGHVWRSLGGNLGSIVYPRKPGVSTVAYLLTDRAAEMLLRNSDTFWCAVDEFMNLEDIHGVAGLHLDPPPATHEDGGCSLIGRRAKPPVGIKAKLRRELLRAYRDIRLAAARELTRWRLGIRPGVFIRPGRGNHGT